MAAADDLTLADALAAAAATVVWFVFLQKLNSGQLQLPSNSPAPDANDNATGAVSSIEQANQDTDSLASSDTDILARTIYGEARGQSYQAQVGVASVVMNRFKDPANFPIANQGIAAICLQPKQFSAWNVGNVNRPIMLAATLADPKFQQCYTIADQVIAGKIGDNTQGATFYHDSSVATPQPPEWPRVRQTVQYGKLTFFAIAGSRAAA